MNDPISFVLPAGSRAYIKAIKAPVTSYFDVLSIVKGFNDPPAAPTWSSSLIAPDAFSSSWTSCALSENGNIVLAGGNRLMLATDGNNFNEIQLAGNTGLGWMVAMSKNGNVMLAADGAISGYANSGRLFLSTNQGANWAEVDPVGNNNRWGWTYPRMSYNGQVMVAFKGARIPYVSYDGGSSWALKDTGAANNPLPMAIDMSEDGQTIIVGYNNGTADAKVFRSINGGNNWDNVWPAGMNNVARWTHATMTANGQVIFIRKYVFGNNSLFRSLDGGNNWTDITAALNGTDPRNPFVSPNGNLLHVSDQSWFGGSHSNDLGNNFTEVTLPNNNEDSLYYFADINNNGQIAVYGYTGANSDEAMWFFR